MNVTGGFNTILSFSYASCLSSCTVNIFDGINGTGNLLATFTGDSNNPMILGGGSPVSGWDPATISFTGTDRSVVYFNRNEILLDDISFYPGTAQAAVPTLGEWGLIFLGGILLVVGSVYIMRRRNSVTAC